MSDPEKELKNIESMMFGGFIEPTPKNGIAWRVFEAVMGLRKQRDQWRECAERLIDYAHESLAKLASWGSGYERYKKQMEQIRADIAEFDRLKEASK